MAAPVPIAPQRPKRPQRRRSKINDLSSSRPEPLQGVSQLGFRASVFSQSELFPPDLRLSPAPGGTSPMCASQARLLDKARIEVEIIPVRNDFDGGLNFRRVRVRPDIASASGKASFSRCPACARRPAYLRRFPAASARWRGAQAPQAVVARLSAVH